MKNIENSHWVVMEKLDAQRAMGLYILLESCATRKVQIEVRCSLEGVVAGECYLGWSRDFKCGFIQTKKVEDDIVVSYQEAVDYLINKRRV